MKKIASLMLALTFAAVGQGATYTWTGANAAGNWSLGGAGGNWNGGTAPTSSVANAFVFQSNTSGQISTNDIGSQFDVDTMTFNVSGMTLSGGSIRFNTATATKMIFGANAVTINNDLELAAATTLSTSTGNPIVFNGKLIGPSKLSYVNAGTSSGTLLRFASPTANTINGFTLGNATSGKGKATIEIGMDDPFGGAGTTAFLNNSGGVTFKAIGGNRVVASGIQYRDNPTFSGSFDLTFQGNGVVDNTTARTVNNNLDTGKTLTLGTSSSTWNLYLTTFSGTGFGVLAATVIDTGTGGFLKTGTGTWRLTGTNTYATQTRVQDGVLEFNSVENKGSTTPSALGKPTVNGTNDVIVMGGATLVGSLKYTGTNAPGHSTDRLLSLAGTTGGATLDASGNGPVGYTAGFAFTGAGNKTVTLAGANTGANTLGGAISNSTGFATALVKNGAGSWRLTGASSYTGATTISNGTLLVNGSISGSAVTVKTNATLGGTGNVAGSLTVDNGGFVAPGTSVGTLTNDLTGAKTATFSAGSKFTFELGTPGTSDVLAFTGLAGSQVAFNGNTVNFVNAGGLAIGTYTLFTFDAASAYSGTLSIGTGLEVFNPSLVYNANSIQLVIEAGASTLSTVSIAKLTDGAEEGPVNGVFTISRDNEGTNLPITVYYATSGSATPGSDYTALSSNVLMAAGVTNVTVTVPVRQDNDFNEGTETVVLTLSADSTYTVGTPSSASADLSDGIKPVVSIAKSADGAEAGPVSGTFTVSRPAGQESTNFALTVFYTTNGSTAQAASDYTALAGSVTIGAGQTNATITVPVLQDGDFTEGTETVVLNLSANSAYTVGAAGSATMDITDGVKPTVTIVKTTDGEEAGPVNGLFTVTRSTDNGTASALIVYFTTNASTATAGSDYTALSASVTIGSGQTSATIAVPVLQDTNFAEGTETVVLDLTANATYTVGTPASATVNVTDGVKPVVTIVKTADGSEVGPAIGSFTISRTPESASSGPITVFYTTNGSTATAGSDYLATLTGAVTMAVNVTNATLAVTVLRDGVSEPGETVEVALSSRSAYTIGDPGAATVAITDDVAPLPGAKSDFTAVYTFSNSLVGTTVDPTPPPYEAALYFGAFSMHGHSTGSEIAGTFCPRWADITNATPYMNKYFEVTLTPLYGSKMTVTNMAFDVHRQASIGPTRYVVRSSLDDYASNIGAFTISPANAELAVEDGNVLRIVTPASTVGAWQTGANLALDGGFADLTASVTFRVYPYTGPGTSAKYGGIDTFAIRGSWAVPSSRGTLIMIQ